MYLAHAGGPVLPRVVGILVFIGFAIGWVLRAEQQERTPLAVSDHNSASRK